MGFRCLVRDQEVDGSNPFAPTNLLESATYKTGKRIERLAEVRHCAMDFEFFRGQLDRKSLRFNRACSKIGCSENLPPCLPIASVTDCLHVPAKDSHP